VCQRESLQPRNWELFNVSLGTISKQPWICSLRSANGETFPPQFLVLVLCFIDTPRYRVSFQRLKWRHRKRWHSNSCGGEATHSYWASSTPSDQSFLGTKNEPIGLVKWFGSWVIPPRFMPDDWPAICSELLQVRVENWGDDHFEPGHKVVAPLDRSGQWLHQSDFSPKSLWMANLLWDRLLQVLSSSLWLYPLNVLSASPYLSVIFSHYYPCSPHFGLSKHRVAQTPV
jgi:hypothetical protein